MQKFLRGERPLWFTFWIGFIIPVFIFEMMLIFLANQYVGEIPILAIAIVYSLYLVAITIAVWKSAGGYGGRPAWAILAKAVVAIKLFSTAGAFAGIINKSGIVV